MASVGDRFKTGQTCASTSGVYIFDGYVDGSSYPSPTQDEQVIPLSRNETFPPVGIGEQGVLVEAPAHQLDQVTVLTHDGGRLVARVGPGRSVSAGRRLAA